MDPDPLSKLPENVKKAIYECEKKQKTERFAFIKTIWEIIKEIIK